MTTHDAKSLRPLGIFLAVFYAVWTLRAIWLIRVDEALVSPLERAVFSQGVKFCLWVLPAMLYVRCRHHARVGQYLGWASWPEGRGPGDC